MAQYALCYGAFPAFAGPWRLPCLRWAMVPSLPWLGHGAFPALAGPWRLPCLRWAMVLSLLRDLAGATGTMAAVLGHGMVCALGGEGLAEAGRGGEGRLREGTIASKVNKSLTSWSNLGRHGGYGRGTFAPTVLDRWVKPRPASSANKALTSWSNLGRLQGGTFDPTATAGHSRRGPASGAWSAATAPAAGHGGRGPAGSNDG